MSVIVRSKATGELFVFAKGANTQILDRLTEDSMQSDLKQKIDEEVYRFGAKGLRTLVFAMRKMTEAELS